MLVILSETKYLIFNYTKFYTNNNINMKILHMDILSKILYNIFIKTIRGMALMKNKLVFIFIVFMLILSACSVENKEAVIDNSTDQNEQIPKEPIEEPNNIDELEEE